jgi:predicted permease
VLAILGVVAPVFLIVATGWAAVRTGRFSAAGVDGLMRFATNFAVPALLALAIFRLDLGAAFDGRMMLSFYGAATFSFACATTLARLAWRRRPGESVAIGFSALFSNSVLIGIPIMTAAYGAPSLDPMFAIVSVHAPFCYLLGITVMEIARREGGSRRETALRAARAMFSNALTIGLAVGFALNLSGLPAPGFVVRAAELLAAAALPAALFGLGGALTRYSLRADFSVAAMAVAFSVVVHPAVAWALSAHVFALPVDLVRAAVVTAAMPPGLNAYLFATMYGRAQGAAASAVLLGTGVAVGAISFWLWLLG